MYEELVKRLREHGEFLIVSDRMKAPPNVNVRNVFAEDYYQAADAIAELRRRETPMRLRITTSTKRCPSCNKQVSGIGNIHGNYRYCRWCGQAIDWSEPPKEET